MINLKIVRSIFTFSLAIIYLGNLLVKSNLLNDIALILLSIVIVFSYINSNGSSKIIGVIFFALSFILLLVYQAPLYIWKEAVLENLYLVVLFTLVPLLTIPIQHGGYFNALQHFFFHYVNTNKRYYLFVTILTTFIGVLVNVAVVHLVYGISRSSEFSSDKKLSSLAVNRGFNTASMWTPTMVTVPMILQLTGVKWVLLFPYGFLFSLIAALIGYIMIIAELKTDKNGLLSTTPLPNGEFNVSKILELSLFIFILLGSITVVTFVTGLNTINIVSIACLFFPVIWLAIIGRLPILYREFKDFYFKESLQNLSNTIMLFIGAGIFVNSISYSQLGAYVPQFLFALVDNNILFLSILIAVISLSLSAVGVHPIISTAIIGGTINATACGISSLYMALLLTICFSMGTSVCPAAANIIAIAEQAGQSPIQVGTRWNGLYAVIVSLVLIILINILGPIGIL
jgi:DcuC family C4-dicarboxylate transporter